jgi:hypothetical protein
VLWPYKAWKWSCGFHVVAERERGLHWHQPLRSTQWHPFQGSHNRGRLATRSVAHSLVACRWHSPTPPIDPIHLKQAKGRAAQEAH